MAAARSNRNLFLFLIILLQNFLIDGKISDLRLCGDPKCEEPISEGKTIINYNSPDAKVLSFKPNAKVVIYSKSAGSNLRYWGGKINGRRGYFPKEFIKESRILRSNLSFEVSTNEEQVTKKDIPDLESSNEVETAASSVVDKPAAGNDLGVGRLPNEARKIGNAGKVSDDTSMNVKSLGSPSSPAVPYPVIEGHPQPSKSASLPSNVLSDSHLEVLPPGIAIESTSDGSSSIDSGYRIPSSTIDGASHNLDNIVAHSQGVVYDAPEALSHSAIWFPENIATPSAALAALGLGGSRSFMLPGAGAETATGDRGSGGERASPPPSPQEYFEGDHPVPPSDGIVVEDGTSYEIIQGTRIPLGDDGPTTQSIAYSTPSVQAASQSELPTIISSSVSIQPTVVVNIPNNVVSTSVPANGVTLQEPSSVVGNSPPPPPPIAPTAASLNSMLASTSSTVDGTSTSDTSVNGNEVVKAENDGLIDRLNNFFFAEDGENVALGVDSVLPQVKESVNDKKEGQVVPNDDKPPGQSYDGNMDKGTVSVVGDAKLVESNVDVHQEKLSKGVDGHQQPAILSTDDNEGADDDQDNDDADEDGGDDEVDDSEDDEEEAFESESVEIPYHGKNGLGAGDIQPPKDGQEPDKTDVQVKLKSSISSENSPGHLTDGPERDKNSLTSVPPTAASTTRPVASTLTAVPKNLDASQEENGQKKTTIDEEFKNYVDSNVGKDVNSETEGSLAGLGDKVGDDIDRVNGNKFFVKPQEGDDRKNENDDGGMVDGSNNKIGENVSSRRLMAIDESDADEKSSVAVEGKVETVEATRSAEADSDIKGDKMSVHSEGVADGDDIRTDETEKGENELIKLDSNDNDNSDSSFNADKNIAEAQLNIGSKDKNDLAVEDGRGSTKETSNVPNEMNYEDSLNYASPRDQQDEDVVSLPGESQLEDGTEPIPSTVDAVADVIVNEEGSAAGRSWFFNHEPPKLDPIDDSESSAEMGSCTGAGYEGSCSGVGQPESEGKSLDHQNHVAGELQEPSEDLQYRMSEEVVPGEVQGFWESVEDFLQKLKENTQIIVDLIPEPVQNVLHSLESSSVSPRVIVLTVIVGSFVLLLQVFYITIKIRCKERSLVSRICSMDKKLFVAVTERDELKKQLTTASDSTHDWEVECGEARKIIKRMQSELKAAQNKCDGLQANVTSLEEQLECATDAGLELNSMLSEFLTSQSDSGKLQLAVEQLQRQLEGQQHKVADLQLVSDSTYSEKFQLKVDLENSQEELDRLKKSYAQLETERDELNRNKDDLLQDTSCQQEQILQLSQSNEVLLKEAEVWNESVQQLEMQVQENQKNIQELNESLIFKNKEVEAMKECISQLSLTSASENRITSLDGEESDTSEDTAKIVLKRLMDVSTIKAELKTALEERDSLWAILEEEKVARSTAEGVMETAVQEASKYKEEYEVAHQEREEALTKLGVLSNYFKEKELQLQKELGVQEAMRQQTQENVTSVTHRIAVYEQEIDLLKSQVTSLKSEIDSQERSYKNQITNHEKKAHENWLAARSAERKLEESKQQATNLRNKLTLMEQEKSNIALNQTEALKANHNYSESNGEVPPSPRLGPSDRSDSMDLPTSGRSSMFREPMDHPYPFLPPDRPMPPPFMARPPMMPPMHPFDPRRGPPFPLLPPPLPPPGMIAPPHPDHWGMPPPPLGRRPPSPPYELSGRPDQRPHSPPRRLPPPQFDRRPSLSGTRRTASPPTGHGAEYSEPPPYSREYRGNTPPTRFYDRPPGGPPSPPVIYGSGGGRPLHPSQRRDIYPPGRADHGIDPRTSSPLTSKQQSDDPRATGV